MSPERARLLMLYADGELPSGDAARAKRVVDESLEANTFLAEHDEVGEMVRAIARRRGLGGNRLADTVMAQIEVESRALDGILTRPRIRHVVFSARGVFYRASAFALAAAAMVVLGLSASSGVVERLSTTAVATAEAAASRPHAALGRAVGSTAPTLALDVEAAPSPGEPGARMDSGASIEELELGSRSASVFFVASGEETTPVVWLADDAASTETAAETL